MGIMENEGHDPMGFGNVRSTRAETFERQYRQACQDHATAMAEIARMRAVLKDLDAQSIATTEPDYVAVPAKLLADAANRGQAADTGICIATAYGGEWCKDRCQDPRDCTARPRNAEQSKDAK